MGLSNTIIIAADSVTIEDDITIGAGVKICDADFHPLDAYARLNGNYGTKSSPVIIKDRAFIGVMLIITK